MSSGAARASSRANGFGDDRPRVSGHSSFKTERSDSRKGPSPQPAGQHGATSHKRSASGNPRPASRMTEERERRFEERRVTERTFEAHLERLVPRNTSPERAQRRSTEKRPAEAPRHKTPEARPREQRAETPQGMPLILNLLARDKRLTPSKHHGTPKSPYYHTPLRLWRPEYLFLLLPRPYHRRPNRNH